MPVRLCMIWAHIYTSDLLSCPSSYAISSPDMSLPCALHWLFLLPERFPHHTPCGPYLTTFKSFLWFKFPNLSKFLARMWQCLGIARLWPQSPGPQTSLFYTQSHYARLGALDAYMSSPKPTCPRSILPCTHAQIATPLAKMCTLEVWPTLGM